MKRASYIALLGCAILAVICFFLAFRLYVVGSQVAKLNYLAQIDVIRQPGSTAQDVQVLLGPPQEQVKLPGHYIRRGFRPRFEPPQTAVEVLVYESLFPSGGLWRSYIFLDEDENVVGVTVTSS